MSRSLQQIIATSGISFGTSGARGLVSDFTDEVVASFCQSFVQAMCLEAPVKRLALAIDNRPSSPAMAAACAGAAQALGVKVDYYGVIPTPALAYQAMQDAVPAIMVTGSHIPFDRNGLKFYRPSGEITKADEQAIMNPEQQLAPFSPAALEYSPRAADNYLKRYSQVFPANSLQGLTIGLYEHSSAGRDLYAKLFRDLGAEVTSLERTDHFVPIDTEAVNDEDRAKGQAWSQAYGFDAIFSTDGDGDRPLIADEQGNWLRGDIVGLLCARALSIQALAVPVSCNTAIEQCAAFNPVVRTKIGSPYVIEAMQQLAKGDAKIAGFEANGGFLLGSDIELNGHTLSALPTRDALLPGLCLMAEAAKVKLSQQLAKLPQRYSASDRLQNIASAKSKAFIEQASQDAQALLVQLGFGDKQLDAVNHTDGLRMHCRDGDIIHLRPSGNAPELRCYSESASQAEAVMLVKQALAKLHTLLS